MDERAPEVFYLDKSQMLNSEVKHAVNFHRRWKSYPALYVLVDLAWEMF